jgi:hypothetical protein
MVPLGIDDAGDLMRFCLFKKVHIEDLFFGLWFPHMQALFIV